MSQELFGTYLYFKKFIVYLKFKITGCSVFQPTTLLRTPGRKRAQPGKGSPPVWEEVSGPGDCPQDRCHGQIFSREAQDWSSSTFQTLYPTKVTFMRFSGDLGGHRHVALDLSSKESKALGEAQSSYL